MDSDNIMYCVQRYASYHALAFVLHLVIHFHVVQQSCSATSLASSLVESRRPWFSLCEGHISWGWCAFDCRVPAGWLRSNLCIGTLDHALCKEFLDLFGISHVVSVLGELFNISGGALTTNLRPEVHGAFCELAASSRAWWGHFVALQVR